MSFLSGGPETGPRTRTASEAPSPTEQPVALRPQEAARAQRSGRGPSSEGRCGRGSAPAPSSHGRFGAAVRLGKARHLPSAGRSGLRHPLGVDWAWLPLPGYRRPGTGRAALRSRGGLVGRGEASAFPSAARRRRAAQPGDRCRGWGNRATQAVLETPGLVRGPSGLRTAVEDGEGGCGARGVPVLGGPGAVGGSHSWDNGDAERIPVLGTPRVLMLVVCETSQDGRS